MTERFRSWFRSKFSSSVTLSTFYCAARSMTLRREFVRETFPAKICSEFDHLRQSSTMIRSHAAKVHYLDASALVKLVADDPEEEPGRDILREYYHNHSSRLATSYCVAEALSAFKMKFLRKRITETQYIEYVRNFIHRIIGVNLEIDEVPILWPMVSSEAERLIRTYGIDFIDCFQIVTIMHGKYKVLCGESQSILITADRELARAARAEGASVWECTTEPAPQ